MATIDTWEQCYTQGWPAALLVPQAYAHPAKFAYGLIRRIYAHARAEAWLPPGSVVLDPFAGVALGALEALRLGCAWVGNELEFRFFMLAEANIAKWMAEYATLPGFGPWAMVTLGDSRRLTELVPGGVACCVASPPYASALSGATNMQDGDRQHGIAPARHPDTPGSGYPRHYGTTPGQLGAMPVGCVITSPPCADGCAHQGGADPHPQHVQGGPLRWVRSGASAGQLGGMDAVVTSPPFGERVPASVLQPGGRQGVLKGYKEAGAKDSATDWGGSPGQLGNATGDTFWAASAAVLSQTYALLRPGGHAIFVCKDYIRHKQRVPFSQQWAALCEQTGLKLLHIHHAMLVEDHGTELNLFGGETQIQTHRMSFFRRLHTKKYPHLAILHEDVICLEKDEACK